MWWWMMNGYDGNLGGWGWIGGVLMFLFWAGVIALIIWGVIRLSRNNNPAPHDTPLETAKARYARGEITREQYEQLKKDLG